MARMGKRERQFSQAEIWDDSALINSWNDALAEYQHYHSIHARGERVEDVLEKFEANANTSNGTTAAGEEYSSTAPLTKAVNEAASNDLEDGEVKDEKDSQSQGFNRDLPSPSQLTPNGPNITNEPLGYPNVLERVTLNTKDEALKNLMISWFYAGYYTRLYESHQESEGTANKSSDQSANRVAVEAIPQDNSS